MLSSKASVLYLASCSRQTTNYIESIVRLCDRRQIASVKEEHKKGRKESHFSFEKESEIVEISVINEPPIIKPEDIDIYVGMTIIQLLQYAI